MSKYRFAYDELTQKNNQVCQKYISTYYFNLFIYYFLFIFYMKRQLKQKRI